MTRLLALFSIVLALALPASAQARADQVLWVDARGQTRLVRGTIKENSLARVVIDEGERDRTLAPLEVLRIVFGEVPPSFGEAESYLDRDDFENAAAKFQIAAGDASAREVVRAAARLRAAEAWMSQGAKDPEGFRQAVSASERFLADFPNHRDVPAARALQARATWLSGDAPRAAELLRALFQEGRAKTGSGYPIEGVHRAGLSAAETFLTAGEAAKAREMFNAVDSSLAEALAAVTAGTPQHAALAELESLARQGEGRCLLASGNTSQARTFFQRERDASQTNTQRFGAQLGLAEALLADGHAREAEIEFAQVSALDAGDRDRVARALLGLAECALRLPESTARQQARRWIQVVRDHYGDTPSARRAKTLSETL